MSDQRSAFAGTLSGFTPICQQPLAHPGADLARAGVVVGPAVEEVAPAPIRFGLHPMALGSATNGPCSSVTCSSIGAFALTPSAWISA